MASSAAMAIARFLEKASGRKSFPSWSVRKNTGMNEMRVFETAVTIAPPTDKRVPRVKDILANSTERPAVGPLRIPPPPRSSKNRPFLPPSDVVVMPPRVTVPLKGSKTVAVSTIVRLENDNPAAVDATLTDPATLKITGRKAGVANLKLYARDESWHALRVDVQ